jgi:glycosyltransferase involved in cell wall biosynthesis
MVAMSSKSDLKVERLHSQANLKPKRLLMLVPHEPTLDPRIGWIAEICARIGSTNIIGFCSNFDKPSREYEGTIYTERVSAAQFGVDRILALIQLLDITLPAKIIFRPLQTLRTILFIACPDGRLLKVLVRIKGVIIKATKSIMLTSRTYRAQSMKSKEFLSDNVRPQTSLTAEGGKSPNGVDSGQHQNAILTWVKKLLQSYRERRNRPFSVRRILEMFFVISETLYRRARGESIEPWLIHATDLYSLIAAIRLKNMFNCPVVYDSHEFWPEAFLESGPFAKKVVEGLERHYVQKADFVITVNSRLAAHLAKLYGLKKVYSVPNAQPIEAKIKPEFSGSLNFPIKFLLQGQVAAKRGIEELLDAWINLEEKRVLLVLRCPANNYLAYLLHKYEREIKKGLIKVDNPVEETALTSAALSADVGIIPYPGPNLNHVFACPNKLSQYMGAGLAILHHSDQEFVGELVQKYNCGLSYNTRETNSLKGVIKVLVESPEKLLIMKRNAFDAVQDDYNWEHQSKIYQTILEKPYCIR